ncbi:MAG: GNAT family protein [Deltaproteobacteria bacterium]|nr:GNAT family protein [Deltaproteobacteria bacterium]
MTDRLELWPFSLALVEAVMLDRRDDARALIDAEMPSRWPGRALVERAFSASLERIRAMPEKRLWGDRLMITRVGERRVVGSVVFHGFPDNGIAEVGYGVDEDVQRAGYATEATRAAVDWALSCEGIVSVQARTFPWHRASVRVLEKIGMHKIASDEHDLLGEQWIFERAR